MKPEIWRGILIPFWGTSLGAAGVFFMKRGWNAPLERALTGFAAGVMAAASVWSLLLPAVDQCAPLGRLAFAPAAAGFWAGVLFLALLDRAAPEPPVGARRGRAGKLALAVTLHNLPEGMAVGAVYAGLLQGRGGITAAGAAALALGVAIQNLPEGAIISMPMRAAGERRGRAFLCGALSGAVEPAGALLTIRFSAWMVPALPVLLGFAAGAMIRVVTAELIPAAAADGRPGRGAAMFALGFTAMMALDCAAG